MSILLSTLKSIFGAKSGKETQSDVQQNSPPAVATVDSDAPPSFFLPVFWSTSNPDRVAELAAEMTQFLGGGYYFSDNLLTWGRNMSALVDKDFVSAWQSNVESGSDQAIIWRRYILATLARHAMNLEGDFVECGAYTGVGVKTIIDYLGGERFRKTFWAYDIFEHDSSMENHAMPEHGPNLYERVKSKFTNYPQVNVVKGLIPDVFSLGCPDRICYLHIDLNQATAEIAALEKLFDLVVPGGVIILDDYEWGGYYKNQKIEEDKWLEARNYKVIPLPTGQGFIIKR